MLFRKVESFCFEITYWFSPSFCIQKLINFTIYTQIRNMGFYYYSKMTSKHWISFCTFKNLCFQKSQWWRGKFIFWHDIHYSKYCKSKNIINETWGIFFRENTYHLVKKEKKRNNFFIYIAGVQSVEKLYVWDDVNL